MKTIQAFRLCLEAFGLAALVAIALFWTFPGALQGLGLTEPYGLRSRAGPKGLCRR